MNKKDEANNQFNATLKLKFENTSELFFHQANALSALGKNNESIDCYDEAIKIDPNFVLAHNNKGKALSKLEKY